MRSEIAEIECDGLCASPRDFPPKWACMIFGYFDESGESGDGYVVVAGFVGRKRSWQEYVRRWTEVLEGRPLHMKELRLGSRTAERRWKKNLERLAAIPKQVGLRPFVGWVRTSDYRHLIKNTTADLILAGYPVALLAMVDAILCSDLPRRDRIEFIFEVQKEFAVARERTFAFIRNMPEYNAHHGKSRVAKSSSIEKSILLEAADYLAYAVLYQLVNPNSQQANLTSPILHAFEGSIDHRCMGGHQAIELINEMQENHVGSEFPKLDKDRKAYLKQKLKEDLDQNMELTRAILGGSNHDGKRDI